jgi:glutamine amidotransferase
MCRLFGFRSIFSSQVHTSLVGADNALINQSTRHRDGWGVAYYIHETPHIIKSPQTALNDSLFHKVSGIVSSQTVLAHLRQATKGSINILNCHPFQYGKWVFAHNGNIKNFATIKKEILKKIKSPFDHFILGDTDSEMIFYYLMSSISHMLGPENPLLGQQFDTILEQLKIAIEELISIIGPLSTDETADATENFLTFILTDGKAMISFQGGQTLHFSTHKTKCIERDTCPYLEKNCETAVTKNGERVNHLLISSEPLKNDNVWIKSSLGQFVAVDHALQFFQKSIKLS